MKKMDVLKKMTAAAAAMIMGVSLIACGSGSNNATTKAAETKAEETEAEETEAEAEETTEAEETEADAEVKDTYKIAIVKQLDHASLDEIANAITAELDVIAAQEGITIEYEVYSGQGEQNRLQEIGNQVVDEQVDAIIPIATLAAQVMTATAEDADIPVVYAAISDPEKAELTGIDYVTGTSDMLNTEYIMDMIFAQNPEATKIGLLYSQSEANSETPIAEAKAYLDAKNIEYVEATGNTNDEIITAASVLVSEEVDAIFTPTDNIVMAAELANAETFIEAKIPHYTGADSFVRNGAFATCGVNYTDLGTKTADLAFQAITEGMSGMEDYYKMDGGIITVNTETAQAIGLDYSMFNDMGEVVEVITTED